MNINPLKNILINIFPSRAADIEGLRKLGQPVIDYINDKSNHETFKNNLDDISFDFEQRKNEANKIINCFNDKGIVILRNFLDKDIINEIKEQILDLKLEDYDEKFLVSKNQDEFKKLRRDNPRSFLLNIRNMGDVGMLDLFNINKMLNEDTNTRIFELLSDDLIKKISSIKIDDVSKNLSLNAYINEGIVKTRGFHVDAFYPVIKGMTYLTDVNSLNDGPYCYVIGSHKENPLIEENKKISYLYSREYTDTPLVDLKNITPIFGEAGTLIFSDQAGHHRGFPQAPNNKRAVLVAKYTN